jgi:hypothetical protein
MKTTFNFYKILYKGIAFFVCMLLLMFFYNTKAINTGNRFAKTTIYFSKASKGKINVQIITAKTKKVELYLFNAGGELIKKLETDTKQISLLQGINEGQYLYQCFEKDIELKSGKLMVNQNNITYD